MDLFVKIVFCLLGVWIILMVIRSGCKTALTNLPSGDFITRAVSLVVYGMFSLLTSGSASSRRRQACLAWFGPVFLFLCIAVYFFLTTLGFALIYWVTGSEPTWFKSFISSGSALSTLGFYTPSSPRGELIAIAEGAVGLGIIVFLITFIPGYQSIIKQREDISSRLYARTGGAPGCEAFYAWVSRVGKTGYLEGVWNEWENFLRTMSDTHSESSVVIYTPSSRLGQSWVVSVFAILDAANLATTTIKDQAGIEAEICLKEGIRALNLTAESLRMFHDSGDYGSVSRERYNALCHRLEGQGHALKEDKDRSWLEFINNRDQYGRVLVFLAANLYVPLDKELLCFEHDDGDSVDSGGVLPQSPAT